MTDPQPQKDRAPLWDVLTFKLAGAATLLTGLVEPVVRDTARDWRLVGLGLLFLGGRDLVVRAAEAVLKR